MNVGPSDQEQHAVSPCCRCSATKRAARANRRPRCISRSRLLKAGQRVATIDLDSRQKSFTHYIENRRAWAEARRRSSSNCRRISASPRTDGAIRVDDNEASEFNEFRDGDRRDRAHPRLHRHRYAGPRQLSDAAGAFDGRYADHAAQRQLRRFRRARHASTRRPSPSPAQATTRDMVREARRQRRLVDQRD